MEHDVLTAEPRLTAVFFEGDTPGRFQARLLVAFPLSKEYIDAVHNVLRIQPHLVTISGEAVELLVQARALHLVVDEHLSSRVGRRQGLVAADGTIAAARVRVEGTNASGNRQRDDNSW